MAKREITTTLKLEGEQEFNKQMEASKNALTNLKSEMAVVSSEFGKNEKSTEALTAKQKVLAEQVEQHKNKVAALTQFIENNAEAFEKDSSKADKYRRQLNYAQADLNKLERELNDVNDELQQHENKLEEARKAQEKGVSAIDKLKDAFQKAQPGIEKAGKALEITGKAAGALTAAGAAAVVALGSLSVVGVAKMAEFAKEAAASGEVGFKSLANNLKVLDDSIASAKAALGGVLLPVLEDLSADGVMLLNKFTQGMEAANGDTAKMGEVMAGFVRDAVAMIREELPEIIQMGGDLVAGLAEGAVESTPEILAMATDIINVLLDSLDENADMLGEAAITLITELANFLVETSPDLQVAAVELVGSLVNGLAQNAPQLVPAAVSLITGLLSALVQNAPLLISAGLDLIAGILQGLINSLPDLLSIVPMMITGLLDAVDAGFETLGDIGTRIIEGILEGLKKAFESVKTWFSNAVAGLSGNANVGITTNGSHAGGLNYVPFDGYIAELHKGEMVVPAAEAQILRTGKASASGQGSTINIYTQSLSEAQIDYLYKRFNAKLGVAI